MRQSILRSYAKLIARTGVNVQSGQEVQIYAELDQPDFVTLLADECYRAGASAVTVRWQHQPLQLLDAKYCTPEMLGRVLPWQEARAAQDVETLPCRIVLLSEDPDGLRGIDVAKVSAAQQARQKVLKPYRDRMENRQQWCIAAVPGRAWAKKLFPDCTAGRAVERLWQAILSTSRVAGDPIANWQAHNRSLKERCARLNGLGIRELHYYGANGTDLRVGMIENAEFKGGSDRTVQGVEFNPNIPTEECFISPRRGEAEGVVYATKPLSVQGQLIDGFWLRFEGGRVVDLHADQNEAALRSLVEMDEGAAYLGECALVGDDCPISRSGLLFYNTLFDENAACHLALGMGFADTIRNFEQYTLDQCRAMGVNDSMIHEDFMIGSPQLNIDALTRSGETVPIFRDGLWAF